MCFIWSNPPPTTQNLTCRLPFSISQPIFLFIWKKKSSLLYDTNIFLGMATHWSVLNLPVTTPLKKADSPPPVIIHYQH